MSSHGNVLFSASGLGKKERHLGVCEGGWLMASVPAAEERLSNAI